MASNDTLFLLTALLALTTSPFIPASARPLNCNPIGSSPNSSLASRLNWNEDSSNCWGSLYQLQACSGEVVLFFLNGETYLGHGCCLAIQTIQRQCWPALLGTLGFTTQETDILKGYCDEAADHNIPSPPSTPPPPFPSVDQPANKTDVEKFMFP